MVITDANTTRFSTCCNARVRKSGRLEKELTGEFIPIHQFRLMSNNAHYYVIFNNKRNASQINHLARQVFIGKEQQRIINAYKRAGSKEYGFIVLSFAPEIPDELTVVTDFWEICPSVYL